MSLQLRLLTRCALLAFTALAGAGPTARAVEGPLALHGENPHYLVYRGRPLVPIGSGEHYGAVLNLDFDYTKYLDELAAHGLTHTRTFSGVYCEPQGAFKIASNTLAPGPQRYVTPWARSDQEGYAGGGNRFDLARWDPAYFERLKDFVAQADQWGVIVELCLFCPFYEDAMWRLSPMNAANNVNDVGAVGREDVYTLEKHGGLLAVHEAVTRKIVEQLNDFDNVYFEVCNEPYFGGVAEPWERHITDVIVAAEKDLPKKHLVSHNIANGSAEVDAPHPAAAILNFHYASPPTTVGVNYHLDRVIGLNETGFKGVGDEHYRMEAWQFLMAGGGLYSHLDYSFAVGHEDGTFRYPETQPGGGGGSFRVQMSVLSKFLHGFDFVRMKPDDALVTGGLPKGGRAYALAEPGRQYAIYVFGGPRATLELELPAGKYAAEWIDPQDGSSLRRVVLEHEGGAAKLESPDLKPDAALRLVRE